MSSPLEAALARHRTVSIAALVILTSLAWVWLLAGAGMGMGPFISLTPLNGDGGVSGMAAPWNVGHFTLVFSMWWIMMVAMMLPSAAPMILLYSRSATAHFGNAGAATGSFLLGYLLAWGGFSFLATTLQYALETGDVFAPMVMAMQSRTLAAAILIAAGIYQLSPLKDICLRHCRNPAQFLSRHFQPGIFAALRMGLLHGSFCVGCCWLLMALLFVGGVMNLAWIAMLTLAVAAEKLLPLGRSLGILAGLGLLLWATILLTSPLL